MYLLDVNVLIALADPAHVHAAAARGFFQHHALREGWATCPLVENGMLRILGRRNYPGGPGSPGLARVLLTSLIASPGHQFWPDDLSLVSSASYPDLPDSECLTDHYLLALAVKHEGQLATFDHRLAFRRVPGGDRAFFPIPLG